MASSARRAHQQGCGTGHSRLRRRAGALGGTHLMGARASGPMSAGADMATRIGSVVLPNPVMTASGTAGHGAEPSSYLDLSSLGAVVVKSLSNRKSVGEGKSVSGRVDLGGGRI